MHPTAWFVRVEHDGVVSRTGVFTGLGSLVPIDGAIEIDKFVDSWLERHDGTNWFGWDGGW